jgi:two-component system, chemotaxis family, protein-glutamate methylesterase/glutaminase
MPPVSEHSQSITRDIVVMGASVGGVEALREIIVRLPPDFPAAVFVVLHIPPHGPSLLPDLLRAAGALPAHHATDGEPLQRGRIYVAPPDRHLLVHSGTVSLSAGPRENWARPAVDPLFRSAAIAYGPRVIGVILSGALNDGTAGLWQIKQAGGITIAQDPNEAVSPSMPQSAMDRGAVDHVLPAAEIPILLSRLAAEPIPDGIASAKGAPTEIPQKGGIPVGDQGQRPGDEKPGEKEVARDRAAQIAGNRDGATTIYVCPECGGTLWQVNAGQLTQFRCHVGHVYSGENLLAGYTEEAEHALWYAVRTLTDKANLTRQLAADARQRGNNEVAARYERQAQKDSDQAAVLEQIIASAPPGNSAG